jgi:hypothetical protein
MDLLKFVIYLFASLFAVVSLMQLWAYRRTRHFGLFIMALTYGISGLLAFALAHWWPLVAGYGLVWFLKFLGLDPDSDLLPSRKDQTADK